MGFEKLDAPALWRLVYKSNEYKRWKRAVRKNGEYKCAHCGISRAVKARIRLECHHIKPKAQFLDLIFQAANGMLLCKPCHIKEHQGMQKYPIEYNYENSSLYHLVKSLHFTKYRRRRKSSRRK